MFWKKKKKAIVPEDDRTVVDYAGFLFVSAIEISDQYYQKLKEQIPNHPLVFGKEDHWYFYFAVAAAMTGLLELNEEYSECYFKVLGKMEQWDNQGKEAAENFNAFMQQNPLIQEDINNLYLGISQWIYSNVKESTEINDHEIDPFISAGHTIVEIFYGWFTKNQLK